jgi:hypothetical protein
MEHLSKRVTDASIEIRLTIEIGEANFGSSSAGSLNTHGSDGKLALKCQLLLTDPNLAKNSVCAKFNKRIHEFNNFQHTF